MPGQTVWSPEISWGTATSDDLVHWRQTDASLVPGPFEVGCWSGCVVTNDQGQECAFYTRVRTNALDRAQIAVARRAEHRLAWMSSEVDVVVDGPPDECVIAFRDPFVWRYGQGWLMIAGAGLAHGEGAVLAYRSTNLLA
ncbi:hypothetical protein M6D93_12120 [Jatrophihabitans telluris]|uniref:Glycosyl hydrolase family 32 N-terminal domain-containing protein n=1 Tax=Jatrophihabitans telluris TaxID=2038343 RepID=A0ABY4R4R5_9ACTN|nr:hypothetical protein M6D93_12120 [Jatrophihabitans telluris]